jgi:hypothetical protein
MKGLDSLDASISVDSARRDGPSVDSSESDATAEVGAALPCDDPQACADFPAAPIFDSLGPTALPTDPGKAFTGAPSFWVVDAPIWKGLAVHVRDADISVTVRLAGGGATTVKFRTAPAAAPAALCSGPRIPS